MKKIILFLFSPMLFAAPSDYLEELKYIESEFFQEEKPTLKPKVSKKKRTSPVITDLEQLYFEDQVNIKASGIQKNKKRKMRSR